MFYEFFMYGWSPPLWGDTAVNQTNVRFDCMCASFSASVLVLKFCMTESVLFINLLSAFILQLIWSCQLSKCINFFPSLLFFCNLTGCFSIFSLPLFSRLPFLILLTSSPPVPQGRGYTLSRWAPSWLKASVYHVWNPPDVSHCRKSSSGTVEPI